MIPPYLSSFISLLLVAISSYAIVLYLRDRRRIQHLIHRIHSVGNSPAEKTTLGLLSTLSSRVQGLLHTIGRIGRPKDEQELFRLRRALLRAGYRSPEALLIFFGSKLCLALCLPVVLGLLFHSPLQTLQYSKIILLIIVASAIGFYSPSLFVRWRTWRRQEHILTGFPDALDLLVVCVEAGLGLDAALKRVGEEIQLSHKILGEEFYFLNLELKLTQDRLHALRNFGQRVALDEINSLIALLIQTDRFGTSIADALRIHADFMRTKRLQKAEEKAAQLPVKLLFPLVLFILPPLFITLLGPAAIHLIKIVLPTMTVGS